MGEPEQGVLPCAPGGVAGEAVVEHVDEAYLWVPLQGVCLLYTSDAADE